MIICFVGPGGSGKTTVMRELQQRDKSRFTTLISYTSRTKRVSEQDGVDYHFKSCKNILGMEDILVPHTTPNGDLYASRVADLEGYEVEFLLCTFRPKGILELEGRGLRMLVVLLELNEYECRYRMQQRGDSQEQINARILRDKQDQPKDIVTKIASTQVNVDANQSVEEIVEEILFWLN